MRYKMKKRLIPVAIAVTLCVLAVSCGKGNTSKNIEVKVAGETDVSEDASTDTISTEETGKTDVSDSVDASSQPVMENDVSNLVELTDVVDFEYFDCKEDGWAQNGFEIPAEISEALVPGAVIEVTYTSESGDMWIVFPDAEVGWTRVGDNINGTAYRNNSCTKVQIPYEMIVEYCGEDKHTWGKRLQCESSASWHVTSVRVGKGDLGYSKIQDAENTDVLELSKDGVLFEGFECAAGGWTQVGYEMPEEIIQALVPGSVVNIKFSSATGLMWIVFPDAEVGWMRVGDGINGTATYDGDIAKIPYEMIVEYCGEDISKWGPRLQCESDVSWEVHGIWIE